MNVSRRRYMGEKGGGGLPTGYTQVEYIENQSDAYINTGVKATGTTRLTLSFDFQSASGSLYILGCSSIGALSESKWIGLKTSSGNIYAIYGANTSYKFGGISLRNAILTITGNVVDIERGETSYSHTFTEDSFTSIGSILFLASSQNNAVKYNALGKIYGATIDDVRNFVPCINPNNVVGLYDTIGRQFYSSPNGTAFVAGNPV